MSKIIIAVTFYMFQIIKTYFCDIWYIGICSAVFMVFDRYFSLILPVLIGNYCLKVIANKKSRMQKILFQ